MNKLKILSMLGVASFGVSMSAAQVAVSLPGTVNFGTRLSAVDSATDNTFITNAATTGTGFTMGFNVTVTSGTVNSVITSTWAQEAAVRLQNSAYPSLNAFFRLSDANATFTSYGFATPTVRIFGAENFQYATTPASLPSDLPGAAIPAGSTWDVATYDYFDDGVGADSTGTDIAFTINAFVPPVYQFTAAGPIPSNVGAVQDPTNANLTGPVVASAFTLSRNVIASSTYTQVVSGDWPDDTVVVLRNSAIPNSFASVRFAPVTTSVASATFVNTSVLLGGPLVFSNIPAGSTFSFEFFNTFMETGSAAGNTEANFTNVDLRFNSTTVVSAPTATDLGALGAASTVTTTVASGANLSWYRFSLSSPVNFFSGSFFDIFTGGVADDTEISLYTDRGNLLATDDDSDIDFYSALTFGTGGGAANGNGLAFNGRNGFLLPAGTYYLAVGEFNMVSGDNYVVTSDGLGFIDPVVVTLRTGGTAQQVTLPLNFAGAADPFAASRTMRYSVTQGTTTLVSSTNFTATNASQNVVISIPASATGAVTIEIDGAQYLKRKVSATLTGSAQTLSAATVLPGDVDNNGEVDLTDIDLIIGDYLGTGGSTEGTVTDLDNNGEVDLTDIDLAIGNYLLGDD